MRKSIIIADDEELSRELLKQMFENDYNIILAKDGKEAIYELSRHVNDVAAVLLDLVMPVLNGYQVLQVLNAKRILDKIPVALITAQADAQVEISCYTLGASAVISKPFVAQVVKTRVNNIIEMHKNAEKLEETIQHQQEELDIQKHKLDAFNEKLLDAVSDIIEFRNVESGTHIKRVKGLTRIMAQTYMGLYPDSGLTQQKIDVIVRASVTHDIGKIAIPDSILLKPGRLTDDERQIMMSHTTKGCECLNSLIDVQDSEQFAASYDICRHHHERYDGNGYPDGLAGDAIPLSAQLVSIVDVYDALVSARVYKKPFDRDTAFRMILNGECGIFSPKIMNCFEKAKTAIEEFSENNL